MVTPSSLLSPWICTTVVLKYRGMPKSSRHWTIFRVRPPESIQLLPNQVHHKNTEQGQDNTKGGLVGLYNKTIGGRWYQRNKKWFEYPLGGTLNIFQKHSGGRLSFGREEEILYLQC